MFPYMSRLGNGVIKASNNIDLILYYVKINLKVCNSMNSPMQ